MGVPEGTDRRCALTEPKAPADNQVLELYKLSVEMADRVSARRATANAYFLTVQTTFLGVAAFAVPNLSAAPRWTVYLVATAGSVLSASWWLLLRSYRDLNRAKFAVILKTEELLPLAIFTEEWSSLKADKVKPWRGRYAELGTVERLIPWVFVGLYVVLAFVGR